MSSDSSEDLTEVDLSFAFVERSKSKPRTVAVLDIGATSVRMAVAEIAADGTVNELESLSQAVSLGRDTFTKNEIKSETIEDCVRVLKIYRAKLDEYQVKDPRNIRVVATSAVREARNRLALLDRIFIATGFEIEPFDEAELHRVTYLSIAEVLQAKEELSKGTQLVCEIGGGSTEVLGIHKSDVIFSQTFRLGSLRLRKTLEAFNTPVVKTRDIMERQIGQTVKRIVQLLRKPKDLDFIAMGGDMRFALSQIAPDNQLEDLTVLKISAFKRFVEQILKMTPDQLFQKYELSYPEAEILGPSLLANYKIAAALNIKRLYVANANIRDGLLKEMAYRDGWSVSFRKQIIRFAIDLGRKFKFDEKHARQVARTCDQLFTSLQEEHDLDHRHQVILFVAALLSEIGQFVNHRSYHKHTMYLIRNNEFFGFGKKDMLITSLVARYHRRAHPQPSHEAYASLDRADRVAVSKMAAILRIAKSLDESRSQRISEVKCQVISQQFVIQVPDVTDLSLEQLALRQASSLFEAVFGKQVVLTYVRT